MSTAIEREKDKITLVDKKPGIPSIDDLQKKAVLVDPTTYITIHDMLEKQNLQNTN
jgi:hypothetical protein